MLGKVPLPDSRTLWGLPAALSVIEMLAARDPVAVGVNFTLNMQFAPGARVAGETGQLFAWEKSPEFVPVIPKAVMAIAPVPVFVSVTTCATLDVPTF
jgi:hypothetical protein